MKRFTTVLLSFIMIMSVAVNTAADSLDDTASYLVTAIANPSVASVGGEWTIIGLARSGADVPLGYFDKYYSNVLSYVRSKGGNLHQRKYTEYSRVILALTAIGKNPEDTAGYNLVTPVLDYDKTVWQGINGSIWAIIALDSGDYGTEEIRNKYLTHILSREKKNGGWALSDSEQCAEADITAMALIALSRYSHRQDVSMAINRGVAVLSELQNENGGYTSYGSEGSESCAQVLTALSALGISYNDARFVKNGKTIIDNILSFRHSDGSFSHTNESNLMATEQCYYALVAAKRLEENKTPLFDMKDTKNTSASPVGIAGKSADVNVPGITNSNKTFSDISGHKNQAAIEGLAQRGIISGIGENIFAPDNTMTRAEFATITVRALGLPLKNRAIFEDISEDSWYAQYVNTACVYGIVNGISDKEFNPGGTITNEQACAMLVRAAQLCGMENNLNEIATRNILAEFTDYPQVSEWAKTSVAFCFDKCIADRSVMEIEPGKAVARCKIADMLYNLLKGAMLI